MREIKVSVIIPIYNVEEYLEECLQSVVDQTLEDLQVIMVDDGSLDGSTDIAKKFASRYDHFEYVRQVNGGLGNARNTGVKYAKGKYIIFLDSDDIVPDDAYEKMYLAAEKNHSEMVVGSVARFNSKKDHVSNLHEIAFRKYIDKTHITDNTDLIYDTTSWNKLILKEFWDRNHFEFPERILYEDIPVTIPMHYLANNVTMVQDVCYRWRIRDGANKSITQRADDFTNMRDRITVLRMVDKFFEENVKEQELWDAKYYKWLYIDLMIYVNNCIYLSDTESDVKKMIMSMYTDPTHIQISDPGHLEGNCVFTYLDAFSKPEHFEEYLPEYHNLDELKEHYTRGGLGDVKIKKFLNNVIQEELAPICARRAEFEKDIPAVYEILKKGSDAAREVAAQTLSEVKQAMKINYFDDEELIRVQSEKYQGV